MSEARLVQLLCPPAGSSCRDKPKDTYFAAMSEARLVQLLCQYGTLPWVHYESSEEVRPCDVVHRILFRGDSSSNNLCIHVIRQHLEKTKHCSGRTENETSICGIKFLVYILVTSQIYCMNCHRCLRDSVSRDQFSRDQLPPDQLSWDQLATRCLFISFVSWFCKSCFKVDLIAVDFVKSWSCKSRSRGSWSHQSWSCKSRSRGSWSHQSRSCKSRSCGCWSHQSRSCKSRSRVSWSHQSWSRVSKSLQSILFSETVTNKLMLVVQRPYQIDFMFHGLLRSETWPSRQVKNLTKKLLAILHSCHMVST